MAGVLEVFAPIVFVIFENQVAKSFKAAVVSIAIVDLGEFPDEFLQIGVGGNHKSGYRHLNTPALGSQVKRSVHDFAVEPKAVFVISDTLLETGGFAISDHEDLFVGVFPAPQ